MDPFFAPSKLMVLYSTFEKQGGKSLFSQRKFQSKTEIFGQISKIVASTQMSTTKGTKTKREKH